MRRGGPLGPRMTDGSRLIRARGRPSLHSLSRTRLASSPLLSDGERQALEDAALTPRPVRAGDELVREGQAADQLLFMADGWALRGKTTRDGGRQIVGLAVPGDLANLDSFLFGRPDYGVRALTHGTAVGVPRDRLLALAAEHPGIARALTWCALVENAGLSQWALCLGRQGAQQRLAHLLCELAVRLGADDGAGVAFTLPLTQEHMADALGLTAVHVNRVMQQLRADGLLVTAGRSVTIPDPARLRALADFDPAYLHLEGDAATSPTVLAPASAPMPAAL